MNGQQRGRDGPRPRGSAETDLSHEALEQARRGRRTTATLLMVVGLAVAATSLLGVVRRGGGAHAQDFLSLGVGVIFMLFGAWLAVFRSRPEVAAGDRGGVSAVLLSAVVIAGGLALVWAIASRLL